MGLKERFKRAFRAFTHGDLKTAQRFDGARFNPSDAGTWAHVDNLSYDAANDSATRARIRARARYVVLNNAYARIRDRLRGSSRVCIIKNHISRTGTDTRTRRGIVGGVIA